jgi:hypothetical protein
MTKTLRICALAMGIFSFYASSSQVLINEVQTSNLSTYADQDGDYKDWFELYNAGANPVNLGGWAVSDNDNDLAKWLLPSLEIDAGEHLILWASGKDIGGGGAHWETAVFAGDTWKYLMPTSEPDATWRSTGFDDSSWLSGTGGFGFGDGDDGTDLGSGTSVFMRKTFDLNNLSTVSSMLLHMDFDDAFVAYLNGVEIARGNIGFIGMPPAFDALASGGHEANGYQGIPIDAYTIDETTWMNALVEGENVLAVQVHNVDPGSSDITGNAWLSLQFNSSTIQFEPTPDFMGLGGTGQLHTNFSLSTGETIYLSDASLALVDEILLPSTALENSYGRMTSGAATWCFVTSPTPDEENANSICALGYEPKPIFSIQSGIYNNAQTISLSTTSPTADIRYTTDGSIPSETSTLYNGAITLTVTTVLSARCFSNDGLLPSMVEKNTYMIDEDYLSVPVICISTNPDNLWDENIGIYAFGPPDYGGYPYFGANFWEDWERESYIEYYTPNGDLQFEGPIGLKIHGGWSRGQDQKSLRVMCRDDYGMDEIEYPLIADKPFITDFKSFNLRNGGNEYGSQRYHDALMQRAMKTTDVDYMAHAPSVCFLNGEYWGFYELRENLNEDFCEDNSGVPADDATVISYNYMGFNIINGSDEPFFEMYNWVMANDPLGDEFYEGFSDFMDVENYIDYIIGETYYMNGDWSSGYMNNTKFWHDDTEGGKWRFMLMDMDFGMGDNPCGDYIYRAGDDGFYTDQIFAAAIQNPQFRDQFILRYLDLRNSIYQTDRLTQLRDEFRDESADAMIRHCNRWGTDYNWWYNGYDGRLNWNDQRLACVVSMLQDHFGLNNSIDITLDVIPAGAGRIHISTIEPLESEYPWTGTYINGLPVRITAIANPGFVFDHWTPNAVFPVEVNTRSFVMNYEENITFEAHFTGSPEQGALEVTEFMYNDDNIEPSGDWIEIHNSLDRPLDLSSMYFKDQNYFNRYDFPMGLVLDSGAYMVIAENYGAFTTVYPEVENVIGSLDFNLNNDEDELRFYNFSNNLLNQIHYLDEAPWPANTDGTGRTVEFTEGSDDQNLASNWFMGCIDGSPGIPYDPLCGVVINIEELNESGNWNIYPNPADDMLFVQIADPNDYTRISMRDLTGKLLSDQLVSGRELLSLNISALASGIYLLELHGTDSIETRKLTIR